MYHDDQEKYGKHEKLRSNAHVKTLTTQISSTSEKHWQKGSSKGSFFKIMTKFDEKWVFKRLPPDGVRTIEIRRPG